MTAFELNQLYCNLSEWIKDLEKAKKDLCCGEAKTQITETLKKIEIQRKELRRVFSLMIPGDCQHVTMGLETDFILEILNVQEDFRAGNEAAILHLLVQVFLNTDCSYPVALLSSNEISRHIYQNLAESSADSDIVLLTEWLIRNINECSSGRMWFQGLRKKLIEYHRFFGFQDGKPINMRTHELVRLYDLLLSTSGWLTDWKTGTCIPPQEAASQREEICQAVGKLGFLSEKGFQLFLSVVKTGCEL